MGQTKSSEKRKACKVVRFNSQWFLTCLGKALVQAANTANRMKGKVWKHKN